MNLHMVVSRLNTYIGSLTFICIIILFTAWIVFNVDLLFEGIYHTLGQGPSSNDNLGQNKMKGLSPSLSPPKQ